MKAAGCDESHIVRANGDKDVEIPGAIWFMYRPEDADKILEFLKTVAMEMGIETPIQSMIKNGSSTKNYVIDY